MPQENGRVRDTVQAVLGATSWSQRVQQIRLVPQRHGIGEHGAVYAEIARALYVQQLSPDFAYIHEVEFYSEQKFKDSYDAASLLTNNFVKVTEADLARTLASQPSTLLVFRTLIGLTKDEFAHSTELVASKLGLEPVSTAVIDRLERLPIYSLGQQAKAKDEGRYRVIAATLSAAINRQLFSSPLPGLVTKQEKFDTRDGWSSVRRSAEMGVPLYAYLHQRHFGGSFRQILDATSTKRGDIIEDAVEHLFSANSISYIRTGSHNQAEIARRFEVHVTPAPDFIVFDPRDDSLRAMLECKGTNNGGTARDKALRFVRLKEEAARLNGVPLFAVLGGIGWARINDALAPVVRDTEGRVFTLNTLPEMLLVPPFNSLARTSEP